jgi:glycosyltransferase involved in cell wall biosynthesis
MNILHFYKTFSPNAHGGVEMMIRQLCQASKGLNITHSILSLSPNPTTKIETDSYIAYQVKEHLNIASNAMSFSVFKKFKQLASQADVVHFHFPWPFMDLVYLFSHIKKPTLVTYHSDIVKQKYLMKLYQPLMHQFLKRVDHIVATSPNYLQSSKVLQQYQEKTSVIPIGIDQTAYPTPTIETLNKWREKFPQPFFLFVGVLRYYKGLHILLEAAKGTEYPILIVGSGPIEIELKQQAQHINLNNIFFLEALPEEDKSALLTLCRAFVFPSHLRSEAFGISLLESAMFGKAMISCEIGTGTSYINIDNETGFVVQPESSDELRTAMQRLYNNPALASQMGKKAQLRYQTLFTADKMAQSYHDAYRLVI